MLSHHVLLLSFQNDPAKTVCATAFICAVAQHIKIGDLLPDSGTSLASVDVPSDNIAMDVDGKDMDASEVARNAGLAEERAAVRESTTGFAGEPYFNFGSRGLLRFYYS